MKKAKAVLSVKFNSTYGSADLVNLFKQDLDVFKNVPGLLEKYYIAEETTGAKGGIYIYSTVQKQETCFGTRNWRRKSRRFMV